MNLATSAQVGKRFAESWLRYRLHARPGPISASFAVTNRCNLRCEYCNTPFLDAGQLDLDQIRTLFARLKDLGIVRLGLAGGEPLARQDAGAIVELAAAQSFWISLNTNLMLYDRHRPLFDKVNLVFTSLDGTPSQHLARRGPHSLDGVLEAIRDLRDRRIRVVAICVVDDRNLDVADELLELAKRLDIGLHFQPRCYDTEIVRGAPDTVYDHARVRAFWQRLLELKKHDGRVVSSRLYLRHLVNWHDYRISSVQAADNRCAAGYGFLYIDPLANAYPCAYTKGKTAPINLLRDDWQTAFPGTTPCTDCAVGPMVEFNMLFRHPILAPLAALSTYG